VSSTSSTSWNGWFTGAAVTAVLAVYTGWINDHPGSLRPIGGGSFKADYTCGAVWNPTFPKDGNGPCTEILNNAMWIPVIEIIVTAGLIITGFAVQRGARSGGDAPPTMNATARPGPSRPPTQAATRALLR
jgi:hypothetical protein